MQRTGFGLYVLAQTQLLENGTIIFGYNGIDLRNAANDANDDVLVGISPAGGGITDPGSTDITTTAPFHSAEPTIYELFVAASAPPVDLDGGNVIFTPDGGGGFNVTAPGISGTSISKRDRRRVQPDIPATGGLTPRKRGMP